MPTPSTRPVNSWSPRPATTGPSGPAPTWSPTRPSRIPPRIMPMSVRCSMRNPAVRSIPRAGLAQNHRKAHQSKAIRRTQKRHRKHGQRALASALRGPGRRIGGQRTHAHYRMETHQALPALARVRRSRPRYPGQPGTLARSGHRGAVTVSDRPDRRPVPPPRTRVCTSRANTHNGTNDGTNTERAATEEVMPHDEQPQQTAGTGRGERL